MRNERDEISIWKKNRGIRYWFLFWIAILYSEFRNTSNSIDEDKLDIKLDVHGGITYFDDHLWISKNQKIDGKFIGWDYAHYGDYAGYEEILPSEFKTNGKKWTTSEIYEEIREVCYQIKMLEKK